MKRMFVIGMAVSLLLALPGLGFAKGLGEVVTGSVFQAMDAKKDKVVDPGEMKGWLHSNFEKMDTNKDGKISKEEFLAAQIAPMDTNKDGAIELDEYMNYWLGKAIARKTPKAKTP